MHALRGTCRPVAPPETLNRLLCIAGKSHIKNERIVLFELKYFSLQHSLGLLHALRDSTATAAVGRGVNLSPRDHCADGWRAVISCRSVQAQLSDSNGRGLRSRGLHPQCRSLSCKLRVCLGVPCAAFIYSFMYQTQPLVAF